MSVTILEQGSRLLVTWEGFGPGEYESFIRAKSLPEKEVKYDWRKDRYTLITHKRFRPIIDGTKHLSTGGRLEMAPHLFDYQEFFTKLALDCGRYAVYGDCGLGKTPMGLEFGRQAMADTGEKALISAPLALLGQWRDESEKFYGGDLPVQIKRTRAETVEWLEHGEGLAIANHHQMIPGVMPEFRNLGCLIIDESSILKTGGGKIKWNLIHSGKGIEYKLSLTATPAPNDVMEFASQASFLEKLRAEGEIIWTYFTRRDNGDWEVKPHARKAFYEFLSSWSVFVRNPARYGFKDNTSDIPPPEIIEHSIPATKEQMDFALEVFNAHGAGLFGDKSLGAPARNRLSQAAKGFLYNDERPMPSLKPGHVADIVKAEVDAGRQTLVWTVFDEEARMLTEEFRARGIESEELSGSVKSETERYNIQERFRTGQSPVLTTKASLLAFGLNMQHCKAMVFSGWNDSYEQFYQAVRRAVRYGQANRVRVHIPLVRELESLQWDNVLRKKDSFEQAAEECERCFVEAMKGTVLAS